MRRLIYIILVITFFSDLARADATGNELIIRNISGDNMYIKFYPSSALFNSNNIPSSITKYSLYWHLFDTIASSGALRRGGGPRIKTIFGLDGYALKLNTIDFDTGYFAISNGNRCEFSIDGSESGDQDGLIGYGIYTLEIYKYVNPDFISICDPIIIDWMDFNYGLNNFSGNADLYIQIRGDSSQDINFQWVGAGGASVEIPLFGTGPNPYPSPGLIQVYKQYYEYYNNQWVGYNVPDNIYPRNLGTSVSDGFTLQYPMNGTKLESSINTIYRIPKHLNPGLFAGNVKIDTNISTQETLTNNPTSILTPINGYFKISNGKTFEMITPVNGYNILVVQDSSTLTLDPNSRLVVDAANRLLLKKTGTISLGYNSEILFKDGSSFCNQGGVITSL